MKKSIISVIIFLLFLSIYSCELLNKREVRYKMAGNTPSADILFIDENHEILNYSDIAPPWEYIFTAEKGDYVSINAFNNMDFGSLSISIYCDDEIQAADACIGDSCIVWADCVLP